MSVEKLKRDLGSKGFLFSRNSLRGPMNDCNWYAWRTTSLDAKESETNDKKPSIVVYPSSVLHMGERHESVEIELRGAAGGTWWQLRAYSLRPVDLIERLPGIELALIAAWNSLHRKVDDPAPVAAVKRED